MSNILGMRGNGQWVADQRPKNWREAILYLYPNGTAPLTAMLAKLKSRPVDDPEFNWWTKALPTQGGAVTNVFTDVLSTAYVSGGVAGDTLYVQMAEAVASEFRTGHQALLRYSGDLNVDVNCKVTARTLNGANSYLTVKLLEDDDNSASYDISDVDSILIVGNINSEGATMPDPISYDPVKVYNYTQIFRNSLAMTRTAMKTRLRTGDQKAEAKREALELHSIEQEKAFLVGVASEVTGDNGQPERTTAGLITVTKQYGTVDNFTQNADFSGGTWLNSGEEWLDAQLELIFRYGATRKMAFVGSTVLTAINRLVKASGQYSLTARTAEYGLEVVEWVTPHGTIYMKTHPLFSYEAATQRAMLIFDPAELEFRYIDDTQFIDRSKSTSKDGSEEEYLTEAGLEFHHPIGFGWLHGFGLDSAV